MNSLRSADEQSANTSSDKIAEEREITELLATLVRAHYLEKSSKFQLALDFEKLFKLDSLENLKYLEELGRLRTLEQLVQLDNLKELGKLRDLSHLPELRSLSHLEKLKELEALSKLDRLTQLNQLDKLEELKSIDKLSQLKELDKLNIIHVLGKILQDHQNTLGPLIHLDSLTQLKNLSELNRLSELTQLSQLEQLNKLEKLDRIEDARFANRLDKLDKLDILQKGTRSLVIQQFIGFGLEIFKLGIAGLLIVFLLSRETGREIVVKALPAIGFGSAAQVSLGLKLLIGEMPAADFAAIVSDVRNRIDAEISTVTSPDSSLSIDRRLQLIEQINSYSFQSSGINLSTESKKKLIDAMNKLELRSIEKMDYEIAIANGKGDVESERKLREIKILFVQKQYPKVLEMVLPQWGEKDSMTSAAIVALTTLKLQDPETLEDILRREFPRKGDISK